jgi:ATP-dependent RNA helicase DeaD
LARLHFEQPTPIQAAAIPYLLAGRDVVGVAQTGTGKTAAFGLPLITGLDPTATGVQGLVMVPTRELALQTVEALARLGGHRLRVTAVYGGAPWAAQRRALQEGTQIVVGTPGRVIDHLERHTLDLSDVKYVVLDEGDEMLKMGFAEEVDRILDAVPQPHQTALFSATLPASIRATVERHLVDPHQVFVAKQATTVDTIDQSFIVAPDRQKSAVLARVLASSGGGEATLVFVKTRARADEVGSALNLRGFKVSVMSGDVAQAERERIVERLRAGQIDVVVATDVAARGLDVERIGVVVNVDLPHQAEMYVHRVGRTGRAGRGGRAVSLVTPREIALLRRIERTTGASIQELSVPSLATIQQNRLSGVIDRVVARLDAGDLDDARTGIGAALETLAAARPGERIRALDLAIGFLALQLEDQPLTLDDPADLALEASLTTRRREAPRHPGTSSESGHPTRWGRRGRDEFHRPGSRRDDDGYRDDQPRRSRMADPGTGRTGRPPRPAAGKKPRQKRKY